MDPIDPTTDPAPATTEPAAPSPEPAPAPLTLDMVKALVAEEARKAYDAGAAAARRAEQTKKGGATPTPPPTRTDATASPPSGNDAEFGETLADAINEFAFDKDQRRAIRDAARSKRPDDVDAFVAQWARMFGKVAGAAPSPTQQNQQPSTARPTASIPSTPAPAGTSPDGVNPPVFRALSEDDRRDAFNAYIRRQGGNPANLRSPETRKALGAMRRDFEAAAAITDVAIGARPTR